MKVFLTGGLGFTGSQVIPLLLKNGFQVRCLYRPTRDRSALPHQPELEWVSGNISDAESLSASMKGTDTLVNMVSLGFGQVDSILHAAQTAGIERAIFISTTAIFTRLNAESKELRLAAEQAIETSGLHYTILRPTMIYGSPRDRNMWRLIRFMRCSPILPIFGSGDYLQQPIYVDDVAQAILACLKSDSTIGKCYNIAGEHPLTYNQVIDAVARAMRKKVWKLRIPSRPVVALLRFFEQLGIPFPIQAEQVLRLNEDKAFSYEEATKDFGFSPLSFEQGIGMELKEVGNT
jgi:nucleoside-diphosphate-sugar epimerase